MRYAILITLLFFTAKGFSQLCDCSAQLAYVINYYEQNNPAFQKLRSDPKSYKLYQEEQNKIIAMAKLNKDSGDCNNYLDQYVSLLKDHHSSIGFNMKRRDLGTPQLISDFKQSKQYLHFKKEMIDTSSLIPELMSKPPSDITGIYSNGSSITFGIIARQHSPNQYIGVVLRPNKLLDVGHILLELTQKPDSSYDIIYNIGLLGFTPQRIHKNMMIHNGEMPSMGFFKGQNEKSNSTYEFIELNANVNYLRLASFDESIKNELDSFYDTIDKKIRSKPYLIIDIRNNGGGSEQSYLNLLPYAYTKPLVIDSAEVWVSPENIKRYEEQESGNNAVLVSRMKLAKPFTFIPFSEEPMNTWALDSVTHFPTKIALLFNRGTASAAEGMILYFMQSDKVITVGENSGGFVGYGNVMMATTPCREYTMLSTTTKYFTKSKFEYIGIPPTYKVLPHTDWIKYAESLLLESK